MKSETLAYCIIAGGMVAIFLAGATFPGYYSTAFSVLGGAVTLLGVTMAQAEAFDQGAHDDEYGQGDGEGEL